jgi:hypothetical protein
MIGRTSPPFPTSEKKSVPERVTEMKDRTVAHIRENKKFYIGLGSGLVIGAIGGGAVVARKADVEMIQKFTALVNFNWKSTQIITQQSIKALGHPGFEVMDNETGLKYPSINNAAKETGINVHDLRKHLHGERPDAGGKTFKIVGLADTSHLMD